MELTVVIQGGAIGFDTRAHGVDAVLQVAVIAFFAVQARQHHGLALDQRARLHQFGGTFAEGHGACATLEQARRDVDTRAHLDLDTAFDLQGDQRLAQRRPRYPQQLRQVAFRGQA
ncbi:hypothetical protein D3C87_1650340 [compost metagenome]